MRCAGQGCACQSCATSAWNWCSASWHARVATQNRQLANCNQPMDILPRLKLDTELAQRLVIDFIRDEITRAGLERAMVGLSGGVDSALVTTLAVQALGAGNMLAVIMPYRTSNPSSRADAEKIVEQLGISSRLLDITPMVEPFL